MITIPWSNFKQLIDAGALFAYQENDLYYELTLFVGSILYECKVDKTNPKNSIQNVFETSYISLAVSSIKSTNDINGNVNANVTFPEVIYQLVDLANGSNINMAVSGTLGSPVVFRFNAPSTQTWYIDELTILINDNANFPNNGFGALTALTNGLIIRYRSKGQVYTFCNLKDNYGIIRTFDENVFSSVASGLLSTDRTYRGSKNLRNRIPLQGSTSDYIEVVVQDNLTGLTGLYLSALVWRINQ